MMAFVRERCRLNELGNSRAELKSWQGRRTILTNMTARIRFGNGHAFTVDVSCGDPISPNRMHAGHARAVCNMYSLQHTERAAPQRWKDTLQHHATGCFCANLSLFLKPAATSHSVCKSEFMLVMHCPRSHPYQQNIPQRHAAGCSCANLMPLFKSVATIYALCRSAIMPGIRSPHRA